MTTELVAKSSTLVAEITALEDRLTPATPEQAGEIVGSLIDLGFIAPSSIKPGLELKAYRIALNAAPLEALKHVANGLMQGQFPEFRSFLPRPAELAVLVADAAKADRWARAKAKRDLEAAQERESLQLELTEAEKERRKEMAAKARKLIAQITAGRSLEEPAHAR
ncbi:hypothetical protein FJU08_12805 [Martelella alba]|uniref:Uncharacterized protein n=1 Tax=Martelella alba TaxID=2590451 RepID=A0A506U9D5_9HYPH|nr:hypothetical protein [Martelella alba]TPW29691.1 hypothetical protein FJU08_12805 [Martelella alba]